MNLSKLYSAIADKDVATVQTLISAVGDDDVLQDALYGVDGMGRTCFHSALSHVLLANEVPDVLRMLQLLDKNLDKQDPRFQGLLNARYNGDTVLHMLASGVLFTDTECAQLMSFFLSEDEYRSAWNYAAYDLKGQTFLHKLCSSEGRPKTLDVVVRSGVDPQQLRACANIRSRTSRLTALHMAGMSSHQMSTRTLRAIVDRLQEIGADATLLGAKGEVMMLDKPIFMAFLYDTAIRLADPAVGDMPALTTVMNLAPNSYALSGLENYYKWTIKMAEPFSYDRAVRMDVTSSMASIVAPGGVVKLHVQYLSKTRGIVLAIDNLYFSSSYEKKPGEVRVRAAEIFAGIQHYNRGNPRHLINRVILRNFSYLEYTVRDYEYCMPLVVYRYILRLIKSNEASTAAVEERAARGDDVPVAAAVRLAGERQNGKIVDTFSVYSKTAMLYGFHSRSGPADDEDASNQSITFLSSEDEKRFNNNLDTVLMAYAADESISEEDAFKTVLIPVLKDFIKAVQEARYRDQARAVFDRNPFSKIRYLDDALHVSTDIQDMGDYADTTTEIFILKGAEKEWESYDPLDSSDMSMISDISSSSESSAESRQSLSGVLGSDNSDEEDSFYGDEQAPIAEAPQGKPPGFYTRLLQEGLDVPEDWVEREAEEEEDKREQNSSDDSMSRLLGFLDDLNDSSALLHKPLSRLQF